jgi:transposase-like protein
MTERPQDNLADDAIKTLLQLGLGQGLPRIAEMLLNAAMCFERSNHLNADPYERAQARTGHANGLRATLNASPWQRCQFHLQQNAQAYVPSLAMRAGVARDIRSAFDSSGFPSAEARFNEIVEKYQQLAPKLASWLDGNIIEGLTVFKLPEHFRRRLRTSNMCERMNREIKRRTRFAGLFPN